MIDAVKAIDKKPFVKRVGVLDINTAEKIRENLKIFLNLGQPARNSK